MILALMLTVMKICLFLSVDLQLVKEVRPGKNSQDFEKWPDESRRSEPGCCFAVLYGRDFRPKTLSLAGMC